MVIEDAAGILFSLEDMQFFLSNFNDGIGTTAFWNEALTSAGFGTIREVVQVDQEHG